MTKTYDLTKFKKGRKFATVGVNGFINTTYINVLRATGAFIDGKPVFKENKKGAISTFILSDFESDNMLLFDVTREALPFEIQGVKEVSMDNGLVNILGDKDIIKEWVMTKNINPFFCAFQKINHISYKRQEALLFPDGIIK